MQRRTGIGRNLEMVVGAVGPLDSWARTVQRQFQQAGCAFQLPGPVRKLPLESSFAQQILLPAGVIGILDCQFRQRRRFALHVGSVQRCKLAHQHPDRPPIGNDVMHHQSHHVLVIGQADQGYPHQRRGVDRERCLEGGTQQRRQLGIALRRVHAGQVVLLERERQRGADSLHRHPILRDEGRTQHFVAAHDFVDGALHCAGMQVALEPNRRRHVVDRTVGIELIEEPQALLPERERIGFAARHPRQGRAGNRRCRAAGLLNAHRKRGHRRRLEQHTRRKLYAELFADSRQHHQRLQRMAAQREEVVVGTDCLALEHFGEHCGQRELYLPAWRDESSGGIVRLLGQQSFAIDLAIAVERQAVEDDELGRHHVLG